MQCKSLCPLYPRKRTREFDHSGKLQKFCELGFYKKVCEWSPYDTGEIVRIKVAELI